MTLVIIGGGEAGISVALRAHEIDPTAEIFPNRREKLVNPSEKHVLVKQDGVTKLMPYDRSVKVQSCITEHGPKSTLIIGAGYIGLEMADALTHRGLKVTVVGRPQNVLPTVEPALGAMAQQEPEQHGVEVWPKHGGRESRFQGISGNSSGRGV